MPKVKTTNKPKSVKVSTDVDQELYARIAEAARRKDLHIAQIVRRLLRREFSEARVGGV